MIRNPQILGSRAQLLRRTVLATLPITLSLGACGLKGPLYMPAPAARTAASAPTVAPAAASAADASTPSSLNTPAR